MILDLAERMMNRSIAASTPARRQLAQLDDESLAVEVDGTSLRIVFRVHHSHLSIALEPTGSASVTVRARPIDLLRLTRNNALAQLKRTGAQIDGEVRVAEAFGLLFQLGRPELEEELARWIGDIGAHQLGQSWRCLDTWGRRSARSIEASIAEYFQQEADMLATADQIESFNRGVEELRDDIARAEQRLERLLVRVTGASR